MLCVCVWTCVSCLFLLILIDVLNRATHPRAQLWRIGSSGAAAVQGEGLSRLADGTQLNVTEAPRLLLEVKPRSKNNVYSVAVTGCVVLCGVVW